MSDFSSVHTAIEIADMRSTIDDIQKILQTIPFNEDAARQKIYEINAKHPDNKNDLELVSCKHSFWDFDSTSIKRKSIPRFAVERILS